MSAENVEVARGANEAWIDGDVDRALAFFAEDAEWDVTTYSGWPEAEVYRGRERIRAFFEQWLGVWERYEAGVDDYVDAGGDLVVVLCWQRGYSEGSQIPVEMRWALVATVRDGLIVRGAAYDDREDALRAAGVAAS